FSSASVFSSDDPGILQALEEVSLVLGDGDRGDAKLGGERFESDGGRGEDAPVQHRKLTLVEPLLEGPDLAHIDLGHQATDGGLVSLAGRLVRFTSHLVVRGAVALKSLQALALHQAPDRCTDTTSRYLAVVHGPRQRH